MIPILYNKDEAAFSSNGLGRLRDCISCVVTEERNGIYECDFDYPVGGANYENVQIGNIIGVTHDESGDIQPFDIVSYSKPINGIVTFHCTHISYRQSYMTVTGSNINSLAAAFDLIETAQPSNPFVYRTNKDSTGYLGAGDGIPHSVRQILGGIQGSILDAYGGEYEWDKWKVTLHASRGQVRDFSIRYGVNMLDYNEDYDIQGTYSSCIPYWTDGTTTVVGNKVDSFGSTVTVRGECVPLDLSDKFETEPTQAQLESAAQTYMNSNTTFVPAQNIHVEFVRLQDMGYEELENLLQCNLCDTITVIFPGNNGSAQYKIVKTVWDVLRDRYESMELGDLSMSLAEALGVSADSDVNVSAVALSDKYTRSSVGTLDWTSQTDGDAKVIAKSALAYWNGAYSGTSSNLKYCNNGEIIGTNSFSSGSDYCKMPDGTLICYGSFTSSGEWSHSITFAQAFTSVPVLLGTIAVNSATNVWFTAMSANTTSGTFTFITTAETKTVTWLAIGRWK
jgi:phage-related protein